MSRAKSLREQLVALGLFEGSVTPDYIERDVRQALQAAHIPKAEVSVSQEGDTISVSVRCRDSAALKEAGKNVLSHLKGEQVPATNVSYKDTGDGMWELSFDVKVVEPVH